MARYSTMYRLLTGTALLLPKALIAQTAPTTTAIPATPTATAPVPAATSDASASPPAQDAGTAGTTPAASSLQSADASPQSADTSSNGLGDIVVTAQRQSQRLRDVPITVTAISAGAAATAGIRDTADLTRAVPGVQMNRQNASITPFIRGIGTKNTSPGDEGASAVFVDGVYIGATTGGVFSFNNIERIEVLKGPQGTLFGRNATGGVIQVVTKDPSQTPTVDASIGYGNYDTITANFYGSAGLANNLAADLAVYENHQGQGWGRNLYTGNPTFKGHEFSARSKLKYSGATTAITLIGDYDDNQLVVPPIYTSPLPGRRYSGGVVYSGFYNTDGNIDVQGHTKQWGVSLKIEQELRFANLVSISAYRHLDQNFSIDSDATPALLQQAYTTQPDRSATQEIQLLSKPGSVTTWIVGGYYFYDKASYAPNDIQLAARETFIRDQQVTNSYAAFGQLTVPIFSETNATAGLRYTIDDRHLSGSSVTNGVPTVAEAKATFRKLTWKFSLDHHFTRDIMVYAQTSRGFKSGLFNIVSPTTPPVNPEVVDLYEGGIKAGIGPNFTINASGFYNKINDIQLQVSVLGSTRLLNAAAGKSYGADIDFEARPSRNFTFTGGMEFLHARYTDFRTAVFYVPNPAGGNTQVNGNDATGRPMINSPDFSINLGVTYRLPTAAGDFTFTASNYYTSKFVFDQEARLQQPDYDTLNLNVGWKSPSGRFGAELWTKNVGDRHYYSVIIPQVFGDTPVPAAPRTFGGTLKVHF